MFRQYLILCLLSIYSNDATDTNYRLNSPIIPSTYSIIITPYFDTGDNKAFTFDGEVTIKFRTQSNTKQIKLHSEELIFSSANISVTNGAQAIALNATDPLEFIEKYTFAYINLQNELQVGVEYTLDISYRGPIRTDLTGFYRNYYFENGVKKWLGATQMESNHARKVFPCFDEPALKATFFLTIDRPANYKPSLANTKLQETLQLNNGYVREVFYPTPKMSTYLVAFLVSEFEAVQANVTRSEFGIYTRPEALNQTTYAFDFGQRVVSALGDYFGIDYYSTDSNLKLDHVALTDFRAGAMENWGLIKYRESLLLYVPEESTPYYKYRAAQIIAHETTHMWFGDLVTCHWWSDTWLNEGFANYFQDYITSLIEPDVSSGNVLVTGSVYSAYAADDTPKSSAITNNEVNSPAEISGHFGTITYQKAGAVIRMMHHLIGDEAFKFGLHAYLETNKFDVGYPQSMYTALHQGVMVTNSLAAYEGHNITDIMSSWIAQAGHPLVKVHIDYEEDTVTLTQQRFYIDSLNKSYETYKIPITYTTQKAADFANTKPSFIMDDRTYEFKIPNISQDHPWILFNLQETGLYRVNYDYHSWQIIAAALKSDQREQIHYLNRAKIVNDLFAFLYADEVDFDLLQDVLEFLKNETDYSVWFAAITGFKKLRNSYLGSEILSDIDTYILSVLENIINKLGYSVRNEDDFESLRNRMQVLELACKLDHQGCVDNTVDMFKNLKDNKEEISPSLRPVAYCNGLRYGNGDDYDFLWNRMKTYNVANEASVIAEVLGCSSDQEKLNSYLLSMTEEDSPIKTQDITVPLTSILSNYSNVRIVMGELKENYDSWSKIYPSMDTVLTTVASALHTESEISDFENWLTTCTGNQQCAAQAVESARNTLQQSKASGAWAESHRAGIVKVLRNQANFVTSSKIMLALSFAVMFYNLF